MYFKNNNEIILIIGSYILEGKQVLLKRPIVLLEKKIDEYLCNTKTYYILRTIITKKIIFRIRPKPIIVNDLKFK
jgi:chromosome transmission fidelity protein 8